jgi:hypothetical protein
MPLTAPSAKATRGRGRPQKYGRPSEIVAVTLPSEVLQHLRTLHSDLGWAIVSLVEAGAVPTMAPTTRTAKAEAELVGIGSGQALIAVSSDVIRSLPGVQLIPLSATQAFLALESGKGMADLEVAVIDRLERIKRPGRERDTLEQLLKQLRRWRRDPSLTFEPRSIILVARRA